MAGRERCYNLSKFTDVRRETAPLMIFPGFDMARLCSVSCRSMLMAACMTASDLCSMYKPWDLQVQLVHVIMEEFWQQVRGVRTGMLV